MKVTLTPSPLSSPLDRERGLRGDGPWIVWLCYLSVMRGMTHRWLLQDAFQRGEGRLPLVQRVLAARGLDEAAEVERFCEPKLTYLHDPGLMPNIDRAVERLVRAVQGGEQIVIYGDYDVDGITATAILYHTIKAAKPDARICTYVPHRIDEGYGINCAALRQLRAEGADVVITVDCGITATESAATARELGLDLIITDHHNLPGEGLPLPEAYALVHPRLPGSDYPFGDLCGAGVAFKLAWRFCTVWCNSERVSAVLQATLLEMLPLAALGTIADVVPLVGENRILSSFGLRRIRETSLVGLAALIEASKLGNTEIDSEKVGFVLGPRLNACGRMGHAGEAVRLLCGADLSEARVIAENLARVNEQRQRTERSIFSRAMRMAEDAGMTEDGCRAIVLADADWHPGVVGIVCSRLVDRFGRPTILMQRNGEICKGSGRSIDGYSIHAGLASCASFLTAWGGHEMAAGLTLDAGRLDAFTEAFIEHANANISNEQLMPSLHVDCGVMLEELDFETVRRLEALSPFGRGNRKPSFLVEGVVVADGPRQMGSQGKHLSLRLRQEGRQGRREVRGVWWNGGRFAGDLAAGMCVDAIVQPRVNAWNGRVSVEVELRDVAMRQRREGGGRAGVSAVAAYAGAGRG